MTSSDEGEIPAIVDIELAQVEEDVNEWWSRRYAQVGDYVIGETSGVIAKCASCFSRII
jgi:hypothetical protein